MISSYVAFVEVVSSSLSEDCKRIAEVLAGYDAKVLLMVVAGLALLPIMLAKLVHALSRMLLKAFDGFLRFMPLNHDEKSGNLCLLSDWHRLYHRGLFWGNVLVFAAISSVVCGVYYCYSGRCESAFILTYYSFWIYLFTREHEAYMISCHSLGVKMRRELIYVVLFVLWLRGAGSCIAEEYGGYFVLLQAVLLWGFLRWWWRVTAGYNDAQHLHVELGREKYYATMHSAIRRYAQEQGDEATVIALVAGWGHGKTHLLQYLAARLSLPYRKILFDDAPADNLHRGRFVICKVSMWQYKDIESAWNGVADALSRSLTGWRLPRYLLDAGLLSRAVLSILKITQFIGTPIVQSLFNFVRSETGSVENAERITAWMRRRYGERKALLILDDVERSNAEIIGGMLSLVERLKKLPFLVVICSFSHSEMKEKCNSFRIAYTSFESFIEKVFGRIEKMPENEVAALNSYYDSYSQKFGNESKAILIKNKLELKFDYARQVERVADLCESLYREYFQPRMSSAQNQLDIEDSYYLLMTVATEILRLYHPARLEEDWVYEKNLMETQNGGNTQVAPTQNKADLMTDSNRLINSVVTSKVYGDKIHFDWAYWKEYSRRNQLSVNDCEHAVSYMKGTPLTIDEVLKKAFSEINEGNIKEAVEDLLNHVLFMAYGKGGNVEPLIFILKGELGPLTDFHGNSYLDKERLMISLLVVSSGKDLPDDSPLVKLTLSFLDCIPPQTLVRLCNGIYCDAGKTCRMGYGSLPAPESGASLHPKIKQSLELQYTLHICKYLSRETDNVGLMKLMNERWVQCYLQCQFDYESMHALSKTLKEKLLTIGEMPSKSWIQLLVNVCILLENVCLSKQRDSDRQLMSLSRFILKSLMIDTSSFCSHLRDLKDNQVLLFDSLLQNVSKVEENMQDEETKRVLRDLLACLESAGD